MRIGYFILFVLLLAGCAKVVSPSGGPKDETPPVIVSSSPENKSVNINNNEITIVFDEYIKPFQANQIIISPYQEEMPELQFIGKSLVIKLQEELEPNTTYSIDFNGAIKDYRQDNVIETLDYAFSSGAVLDTAQFSGQLIEAESGEPFVSETIRVMAYPVGDSLFYKEPPRYLAKVDTTGSFVLKNLVAGEYNLYALDDLNFNNYFDQIGEAIAFLDAPIQTVDSTASEQTLFVHLSKDSINRIENNNKLKEGQGSIVFTQKYQEISLEDESGLYIERAAKSDTLSIWYTNAQAKTQAVFGNGTFIDSLYLREYDDSLEVHQRFRFNSTQFKKEEEPLRLKFRFPVYVKDASLIELYQDSVIVSDQDYKLEARKTSLELETATNDTSRYFVALYPGALENFYGYENMDTMSQRFKKSTFDARGTLIIDFEAADNQAYFIELMEKGKVKFSYPLATGVNRFEKMPKGTYEARLIKDDNGNNVWDTGNIYEGIQPERVIILGTPFKVQSGWENEYVLNALDLL